MKVPASALLVALCAASAFSQSALTEYQIVFLRPTPDRKVLPKEEGERLQAAHMANIHAMADRGVLVAAGPFGDNPPSISGVFVFQAGSLDEARKIASQDPTVIQHRNTVDGFAWRAPKGIGAEYRKLHAADPKTPDDMGIHPFCMLLRGSAWDPQSPLLRQHEDYVAKLRAEGKVAAAGPAENDPSVQSLLIFNRIPDEEAKRLIAEDPAVKTNLLRLEYHRWYSAAHVLP